MIEEFYPEWDEAAALADETRWAQKQNDRKGTALEIINTKSNPSDLTAPDADTMEAMDDDWVNSLKDRKE